MQLTGYPYTQRQRTPIDTLLRRYVRPYGCPFVPLPHPDTDPVGWNKAVHKAFRLSAGGFIKQPLLALLPFVKNCNDQCPGDGKTALHHAAERAKKTGDFQCFNALLRVPGIDDTIKDKAGMTALALLKSPRPTQAKVMSCFV